MTTSGATPSTLEMFTLAESDGPERKRAKREYSYQRNYKASGISSSKRGSNFAHCDSCVTDINIGHGGVHDPSKNT